MSAIKDVYPAEKVGLLVLLKTLTIVVPLLGAITEANLTGESININLLGKWFILSAVGVRLCFVGLRSVFRPGIRRTESGPQKMLVTGIIALCLGLMAILSYSHPDWRITVSVIAAVYFMFAAYGQFTKTPDGLIEWFIVLTDVVIVSILTGLLVFHFM